MSRITTGLWAGTAGGLGMALFLMVWMAATGRSVWTYPNLLAATWLGESAATGLLGGPTLIGLVTHEVLSAGVGLAAVPLIRDLRPLRKVATAAAVGLAAYPLVFGLVLSWANPQMMAGMPPVAMTLAHALLGMGIGLVYLRLRPH